MYHLLRPCCRESLICCTLRGFVTTFAWPLQPFKNPGSRLCFIYLDIFPVKSGMNMIDTTCDAHVFYFAPPKCLWWVLVAVLIAGLCTLFEQILHIFIHLFIHLFYLFFFLFYFIFIHLFFRSFCFFVMSGWVFTHFEVCLPVFILTVFFTRYDA